MWWLVVKRNVFRLNAGKKMCEIHSLPVPFKNWLNDCMSFFRCIFCCSVSNSRNLPLTSREKKWNWPMLVCLLFRSTCEENWSFSSSREKNTNFFLTHWTSVNPSWKYVKQVSSFCNAISIYLNWFFIVHSSILVTHTSGLCISAERQQTTLYAHSKFNGIIWAYRHIYTP